MDTKKKLALVKITLILISCVSFLIIIFEDAAIVNARILLKFLSFTPLSILAILSIIELLPKVKKQR